MKNNESIVSLHKKDFESNYILISLLSSTYKVMERVIVIQMTSCFWSSLDEWTILLFIISYEHNHLISAQ